MATAKTDIGHAATIRLSSARAALSRHAGASLLLSGFILFYLSYLIVLAIVRSDLTFSEMVLGALNNAVSALVIAAALMAVLRRFVIGRALLLQGLAHIGLAPLCVLAWYAAVIIGMGMRGGSLQTGFDVAPFPTEALIWQIFQGFFVYTAAAALSYSIAFAQQAARTRSALEDLKALHRMTRNEDAQASRLLVRDGAELRTVDVADISLVQARDNAVEIHAGAQRYTLRSTLTQVLERLPPSFVRAHRSTVINLNRMHSAEPAGDGRLSLHLDGGHTLVTSRTGARLIRDRIS
jgi:hypothetical protein